MIMSITYDGIDQNNLDLCVQHVFQSVNMTKTQKNDFLHKCFILICQHCAKDNTATTATILISAKVDNCQYETFLKLKIEHKMNANHTKHSE